MLIRTFNDYRKLIVLVSRVEFKQIRNGKRARA